MSIESKLSEWSAQSGMSISNAERKFIDDMRAARAAGVGLGWMQQIIEWEWQFIDPAGAWGPEYFERALAAKKRKP